MKKLMLFLLSAVVLASCQSKPVTGETVTVAVGSYQNITPVELNTMLKTKDFVFVNVHIPFADNITGTDLSIPYDQINASENLSQLPADKNTRIILYCRSGRMSTIAAEQLVALGYTNIWNVTGGMDAWEQAGFFLEK
jgi:phage shock protein E